jgi:hypothetical protein
VVALENIMLVSLVGGGWGGAAGLAVEAIAEGTAGESLFVLRVGFGNVVWSRGMEADGAVALHAANGYVRTLAAFSTEMISHFETLWPVESVAHDLTSH